MLIPYFGNRNDVIEWLHQHIEYKTLSPTRRTGFDKLHSVVFGVYTTQSVVYFKHKKDAVIFALRWS